MIPRVTRRLLALVLLLAAMLAPSLPAAAQDAPTPQELPRLIAGLKQRAAAGDRDAMYELGVAYFNGRVIEFGKPQGIQWLEKAANAGSGPAAYMLALVHDGSVASIPVDMTKARYWRDRALELGEAGAEPWKIGPALRDGPAEAQKQAVSWLKRAAASNNRFEQYRLADAYHEGAYGIAPDPAQSYYWWLRHAAYDERGGIAGNSVQALIARKHPKAVAAAKAMIAQDLVKWRAGAERGDTQALYELGAILFNGLGEPRDAARGLELVTRAAEQAYTPAILFLGEAYRTGRGVAADIPQAVYWAGALQDRHIRVGPISINLNDLLSREAERADQRPYFMPRAIRLAALQGRAPVQAATAEPAKASPPPPAKAPAALEPRFALVIGNGRYTGSLGSLANAENDAKLIADALRKAGFTVDLVVNADQRAMKEAVRRLGQKLAAAGPAATGLFYFAGHGAQAAGVNYIVPVGAPIASESDLDLDAVSAQSILTQMEKSGARTTILVLDACRNLPIQRSTRDGSRGLARMDAAGRGSFIAYAAAPGEVAEDGAGANSPFSATLAAEIGRGGQPIETTFRRVRAAVLDATRGRQTPWESSSLVADFQFTP